MIDCSCEVRPASRILLITSEDLRFVAALVLVKTLRVKLGGLPTLVNGMPTMR
jgi:hypothetical protein